MRKDQKNSITLGGIALRGLYQSARDGDVQATIYILEHPNIGHIDVSDILYGCSYGKKKYESRKQKGEQK